LAGLERRARAGGVSADGTDSQGAGRLVEHGNFTLLLSERGDIMLNNEFPGMLLGDRSFKKGRSR